MTDIKRINPTPDGVNTAENDALAYARTVVLRTDQQKINVYCAPDKPRNQWYVTIAAVKDMPGAVHVYEVTKQLQDGVDK